MAVARECFVGPRARVSAPLFGFWAVFDVHRELVEFPKLPPGRNWNKVACPRDLVGSIVGYRARNRKEGSMGVKGKGKAAGVSGKEAKATKAKEKPAKKEHKGSVAGFLFDTVLTRKKVGTDEDIIREVAKQDFATEKWVEGAKGIDDRDDAFKSVRAQLAWYKNKFTKGEHPNADPDVEYLIEQEFTSDKKRDKAGDAASGKAAAGKRTSRKKESRDIAKMNRKQLKKIIVEFELEVSDGEYDRLPALREAVATAIK